MAEAHRRFLWSAIIVGAAKEFEAEVPFIDLSIFLAQPVATRSNQGAGARRARKCRLLTGQDSDGQDDPYRLQPNGRHSSAQQRIHDKEGSLPVHALLLTSGRHSA